MTDQEIAKLKAEFTRIANERIVKWEGLRDEGMVVRAKADAMTGFGMLCSAIDAAQLAAPVAPERDYTRTFNAIGKAVTIEGKALGISVKAFWEAYDAAQPAQGERQPDAPRELTKIAKLIVQHYADKPDDFSTSIGDWEMRDDFGLPSFGAYLRIPLGDWRKYAVNA